MTGNRAQALLAALLVSAAGCTLFEVEPELRLAVLSPLPTRDFHVDVRVDWPGEGPATLLVNGEMIQDVAVRTTARLYLGFSPEGALRVEAVVNDAGRERRSAPVEVTVDRTAPRLLIGSPPAGVVGSTGFVASATFVEPITLVAATLVTQDGSAPLEASVSEDARTVAVQVPLVTRRSSVRLEVRDRAGNTGQAFLGEWTPDAVRIVWSEPPPYSMSGLVRIRGSWEEAVVLPVTLLGVAVGTLRSGEPLEIDTRAVPDGWGQLVVEGPGFLGAIFPAHVDNTPPVGRCVPSSHAPDDGAPGDIVFAQWSEPVALTEGGPAPSYLSGEVYPPSLPYTWVGALPSVRDDAGNVAPASDCQVTFPVWRSPAGAGAFGLGTEPVVDLALLGPSFDELDIAYVYGSSPLHFAFAAASGGYVYPYGGWLSAGEVAGGPFGVAVTNGVDLHAGRYFDFVPVPDAAGTGLRPLRAEAAGLETAAAWSQPDATPQARQRLTASWRRGASRATFAAGADPGGALVSAAIVDDPPRVAYVERSPVGADRLYQQDASGSPLALGPPLGPLNSDPDAPASAPAAASTGASELLAWVEGGDLLVRVRAPGGAYGPPEVLDDQPAGAARAPAFTPVPGGLILSFVVAGPGGDRVASRRWVETGPGAGSWDALPSLELGAEATEVWVAWPAILWRTAPSAFRYRKYNG